MLLQQNNLGVCSLVQSFALRKSSNFAGVVNFVIDFFFDSLDRFVAVNEIPDALVRALSEVLVDDGPFAAERAIASRLLFGR
jgi:hypothetical protein